MPEDTTLDVSHSGIQSLQAHLCTEYAAFVVLADLSHPAQVSATL